MSKFDCIHYTNISKYEIYVKTCRVCGHVYEYRELDSYEIFVDMCRICDSIQFKKLVKLARPDEVVVLHDGIWTIFRTLM